MLIEAAQHLDRHPGPLGHFFRRLAQKKNRNVAVVAGARKLATIAWLMLTSNEPYRDALPSTTGAKWSRLRIKATRQRRRGGSAKGEKPTAKLPGGSGTIKALAEVDDSECLPQTGSLTAGEQRVVEREPPATSPGWACLVEWDDSSGSTMRMQLQDIKASDLVALRRSFWEGR